MENKLFCKYCPCVWCDGNAEGNRAATGYDFIPDPDHCKIMFTQETEVNYDDFLRGVFLLHGSTVNKDWHRFLTDGGDADDDYSMG